MATFHSILANSKDLETDLAIRAEQYYCSASMLTFNQIDTIVEEARAEQKALETPEVEFQPLMSSWENVSLFNRPALINKTMAVAREVFDKHENEHFKDEGPFADSMKGNKFWPGFVETMQSFVAYLNLLKKLPKAEQDYYFKSFPEGTSMRCLRGTRNNLANVYEKARVFYSKDNVLDAADKALRVVLGKHTFVPHNGIATRPGQLSEFTDDEQKKIRYGFVNAHIEDNRNTIVLNQKSIAKDLESLSNDFEDIHEILQLDFTAEDLNEYQKNRIDAYKSRTEKLQEEYDVTLSELFETSYDENDNEIYSWSTEKLEKVINKVKHEKMMPSMLECVTLYQGNLMAEPLLIYSCNQTLLELFQNGIIDLTRHFEAGDSWLTLAIKCNNEDFALWLLDQNDINRILNTPNDRGETPVLLATIKGHNEVARDIMQHDDFDISQTLNANSNTILHLASHCNPEFALELLEREDIDSILCTPNIRGETPVLLAARKGHNEVARAIMQHDGFDFSQIPNDNRRKIHRIAFMNRDYQLLSAFFTGKDIITTVPKLFPMVFMLNLFTSIIINGKSEAADNKRAIEVFPIISAATALGFTTAALAALAVNGAIQRQKMARQRNNLRQEATVGDIEMGNVRRPINKRNLKLQ